MNIKTIVVGSLAISLAVGGYLFKVASQDVESTYTPRTINGGIYGSAGHAEFLHMLRADPATGQIDYGLVEQVRAEVAAISKKNNKALLGMSWEQMGPDNVGGRTRAVLVDRNNSNIIYAGSVAGGLFVSTDGANTWNPVSGHQGTAGENLIISCITQTDNGRIFFGTGCSFNEPFKGNGVYEYIPSTGAVEPVLNNAVTIPPTSTGALSVINSIAAKGNRLYIGTGNGFFWADPDGSGDYPTALSGWTNPLENLPGLPETGTCQDIDVASDGSMMVCFSGKIYVSNGSDAFGAFTKQTVSGGRISGAIAPSNPNVFYRLRSAGILISLDISLDKGNNWDVIVPGGGTSACHDPFRQNDCSTTSAQGGYDDCIAVNPADWGHIIVGGVQLFEWKYNAGSNPIGGSWLKSANLFEHTSNPYYVHADKHTIVWPTANTVYIGGDGGVFKSTNSGETWFEKNLGYNVTTFYDMQVAANGWFIGGAQDNGSQLFTYGSFGVSTPKGTFEVTGGDGFDCAFSNQGPGVIYTTSQNGNLTRAIPSGTSGSFFNAELSALVSGSGQPFHTVIQNWESNNDPLSKDSIKLMFDSSGVSIGPANSSNPNVVYPGDVINTGDTIYYSSLSNGTQLMHIHTGAPYNINVPLDSMMLQDYIQNKFVFRTSSGIYFTKDAARLNDINVDWYKISNSSNIQNMEFSPDGNSLFMGTTSGQVYRIDGLSQAGNENDTMYDIRSGTTVITGPVQISGVSGGVANIASDPNDGNNLIITTASYTTGNHIFRCTNALSSSPTATAIHGAVNALPRMPIYDADIDYVDNDKVVVGTDWGVWTSDNAFSAAASLVEWTDESSLTMAHCPVYAVEQQQLSQFECSNSGVFYLGTYGRGFYLSEDLANSIDDNDNIIAEDKSFISGLEVYPNPMNAQGSIEFNLADRSNAVVKIYNLSGSLVKTINLGSKAKGANKENINVSELSIG
jgi:hypothetical protein